LKKAAAQTAGRNGSAMTLTTLQAAEYFGESGLLCFYGNSKGKFMEHAAAVANSHLELFVLKAADYKMLDRISLEAISNNYKMRSSWRGFRLRDANSMQTHLGPLSIMDWPKEQAEEGSALTKHIVKKKESWERRHNRERDRPTSPGKGRHGGGVEGGLNSSSAIGRGGSGMVGGLGQASSVMVGTIRPGSKTAFTRSVGTASRVSSKGRVGGGPSSSWSRAHATSSKEKESLVKTSVVSTIMPQPTIARTAEDFKHTLGPSGKLFTHTVRDPTYMERPNHWFYGGQRAASSTSGASNLRPSTASGL